MQTLVLGSPLPYMTPSSHVLAGAWALPHAVLSATELHPATENSTCGIFDLPPEPFADAEILEKAASQTRRLVAYTASALVEKCNVAFGCTRSQRYWDILLAPWLVHVMEILVDRLYRTAGILEHYAEKELQVPLLPDSASAKEFASTMDFVLHGALEPNWNHWLFSRLLERHWSRKWKKILLPPLPERKMHDPAQLPFLRRIARNLLFTLPFPKIKGFSLLESLRLSTALLRNTRTDDKTASLADLADQSDEPLPLGWTNAEAVSFAFALLPQSLQHVPEKLERSYTKTRVISVAACEDDAYRMRVAAWREDGCRLIFIQHGGEYGYVRTSVAYPAVEYSQHCFITWGWKKHGDFAGNFLPLPHPQLARIRNKHRAASDAPLLFVGTEMALLPYTLKSMLRSRQFFAYREAKARFFAALPAVVRKEFLYRPYFHVPSSLPDAEWLLAKFPEIQRCTGTLEPHMLSCRLLILDHAGTTLAQALAAHVPVVLYWNPYMVHFSPEAEPLFENLRNAGILYSSPEEAAQQVLRILDDIPSWWHAEQRQAAVHAWAEQHARTPDMLPNATADWLPFWCQTLQKI